MYANKSKVCFIFICAMTLSAVLASRGKTLELSYDDMTEEISSTFYPNPSLKSEDKLQGLLHEDGLPFMYNLVRRAINNANSSYQVMGRLGLAPLLNVYHEQEMDIDDDLDHHMRPNPLGSDIKTSSLNGPPSLKYQPQQSNQKEGRHRRLGEVTPPKFDIDRVSARCTRHVIHFFDSILKEEWWALKMLDAWGRPPPGVLDGIIKSFGNFRECSKTQYKQLEKDKAHKTPVRTLYCAADLRFFDDGSHVVMVSMTQGLCLPSVCTDEDVHTVLNIVTALTQIDRYLVSQSVLCQRDNPLNAKAVAGLVTFLLLALVTVLGTVLDMFLPPLVSPRLSTGQVENLSRSINAEVESNDYQPLLTIRSPARKKLFIRILLCFSAKVHLPKLLDTSNHSGESLNCICGMRVFTISWIIAGHTILFNTSHGENFLAYGRDKAPDPGIQMLINSTYACDTFLVFSGLLVCYNVMKALDYFNGKMKWHLFYLHRYLRLTPPLMIVMFIYATTFQYWERAPLWPLHGLEDTKQCQKSWWYHLLYINNFTSTQCMRWTWYLAVDTQLYVISPIFLVLLYRRKWLGFAALAVAGVASLVITAWVSYKQKILPSGFYALKSADSQLGDVYRNYYYATWCRWNPYFTGMVAGYLLHKTDHRLTVHWVINLVGWVVCLATTSAIIFGLTKSFFLHPHVVPMTLFESVTYVTLTRTVWGACVAWIIVMCATGHGGPINFLLSLPVLKPLSRVTYMAYLVHEILLMWHVKGSQQPIILSDINMTVYFFAYLVMTYLLAIITSVMFEAPFMAIEKLIFQIPSAKDRATLVAKQNSTSSSNSNNSSNSNTTTVPT